MPNIATSTLAGKLKVNKHKFAISIIWIFAMITGKCFAQKNPWDSVTATAISHSILYYPNAALNIILSLLSGFAACMISSYLLYIILFFKCFAYALVSVNMMTAFGDAGWLLQTLLMFTDSVMTCVLLMFSLNSTNKSFNTILRNAAAAILITAVLTTVDLYLIIPFTTSLLNS